MAETIYYEAKPFLLIFGALYVVLTGPGLAHESFLAVFSLGVAALISYRRLVYRGYFNW